MGADQREYYARLRAAAVAALGGKCSRCGFSDPRALQIDHVSGGGKRERKSLTFVSFYKAVVESALAGESKYQLLCANCNWIKRFERGEHRPRMV